MFFINDLFAQLHRRKMYSFIYDHLCHTGKDPNKIWDQIDDALRHAYLKTEPLMIKSAANYRSKRNFFEMVRFDFVVDEDLNVYIMEVRQIHITVYMGS